MRHRFVVRPDGDAASRGVAGTVGAHHKRPETAARQNGERMPYGSIAFLECVAARCFAPWAPVGIATEHRHGARRGGVFSIVPSIVSPCSIGIGAALGWPSWRTIASEHLTQLVVEFDSGDAGRWRQGERRDRIGRQPILQTGSIGFACTFYVDLTSSRAKRR